MSRRCLAQQAAVWLALWWIVCFLVPSAASGHAVLLRSSPAPDSRLQQSPLEIALEFNERIEKKLFHLRLYNSKGAPVTSNEPSIDADRRAIRLAVPPLADGWYTVTYRVISADGHPIRGSYVFAVGAGAEAKLGFSSASRLHQEHQFRQDIGYWTIRFVYFATLLALIGWVTVRFAAIRLALYDPHRYRHVLLLLLLLHGLGFLLLAWADLSRLSDGYKAAQRLSILGGTSIGASFVLSAAVIASGYFVLLRRTWADALWLLALIGAKGLNGHAMGYRLPWATYALDLAHLAAAGTWAGVVLAVAYYWRQRNDGSALALFAALSNRALAALAALAGSGLVLAYLYTDGFVRWVDTLWGKLLIAKVAAVLLVVAVGAVLRRAIRHRQAATFRTWLIADIALYAAIAAITGVLTYMNPSAGTGPLFWHEKVNGMHIAAVVTPNEPGAVNQFNVSVGTGRGDVRIKGVSLTLTYLDDPEMAPIKVPLEKVPANGSPQSLYNVHFSKEGAYLPFEGRWRLDVRFTDADEAEYVTTTTFVNERRGTGQQP